MILWLLHKTRRSANSNRNNCYTLQGIQPKENNFKNKINGKKQTQLTSEYRYSSEWHTTGKSCECREPCTTFQRMNVILCIYSQ